MLGGVVGVDGRGRVRGGLRPLVAGLVLPWLGTAVFALPAWNTFVFLVFVELDHGEQGDLAQQGGQSAWPFLSLEDQFWLRLIMGNDFSSLHYNYTNQSKDLIQPNYEQDCQWCHSLGERVGVLRQALLSSLSLLPFPFFPTRLSRYIQIVRAMIDSLPAHKKQLYSSIIFNNNEGEALLAVRGLANPEDIANLKHIYDQKIAFQATYIPIKPPKAENNDPDNLQPNRIPSIVGTCFFCLFPEDNRQLFDITNEIFLKRFFAVFLFWRKNFLAIGGGQADLFGPLWIAISYVAIMGFMGNFTIYMVDAISFDFMEAHYANTFGTVAIFTIAEIIFYPSILHCLGGFILSKDAVCIIGYSMVLYYIPTMLCMFTSIAWYITCLFGEGIMRAIFLFRNFSTRIESRTYVLLIVFLFVEFLYAYVLLQVVFFKYSGYTYDEGINQLLGTASGINSTQYTIPQPGLITSNSHMLLRDFSD